MLDKKTSKKKHVNIASKYPDVVIDPSENLNIHAMKKRLCLIALNQTETRTSASRLLGISTRHLYNLMVEYNIIVTRINIKGFRYPKKTYE